VLHVILQHHDAAWGVEAKPVLQAVLDALQSMEGEGGPERGSGLRGLGRVFE
jgi:hypothetical protein